MSIKMLTIASFKGEYDGRRLEVDIPKKIHNERIKQHEYPYQGGPEIEIEIPHKEFDVLNNANRRLTGSKH